MSPHVSKTCFIKTKRNPELQENRGRIVSNDVQPRYQTLDFLKYIPIFMGHCKTLIAISNY